MDVLSFLIGKKHNGESSITVDSLSVTDNGTYTAELNHAYNPVNVSVQPPLQSKNITPSETAQTVSPDENYYGLSEVQVDAISSTYVGSAVPTKAATTYTPTTTDQTIAANQYLTGAQTIKGDANLAAENIKKNVTIFNVEGSYEGSGGGGVSQSDVNFIDYDGTILYAYTAADFANLTALPANPSHEGLTAQGWNWSLADAKTYVATYGKLWIGQMYATTSGDTEIDIELHAPRLTPYLGIAVNGTVEVDWGDGTAKDTVTGTSLTTQIRTPHTYAAGGNYTIKIHKVSGSYAFYGSSTYSILSRNSSTANENRIYANAVKNIRIPSSVTNIGNGAFYGCYSLSAVTIPSSVTSIGDSAFNSCYYLPAVTIPSSVTSIGSSAFQSCTSLHAVTIPSSVTNISSTAFRGCSSLSAVIIPISVTSIGDSLFRDCVSLSAVTIPSGVTSIGSNAFNGCMGLGSIVFMPSTPPTVDNSNAWTGVPTDCKIIVPYSADHSILNTYKTATNYPDPEVYTYEEASA